MNKRITHTLHCCLWMLVIAVLACGCHGGKRNTNDSQLVSVNDEDEEDLFDHGVDPTHEMPCPEFETIEEAEVLFAQSGLNYCFCNFIADHPATMDYPFQVLQESENMPVTIADAPDNSIRIYGWDNHMGGTCISWSAMYQIRDKGKVYTFEELPDWDGDLFLITDIYVLPHPKRNLYLFDCYYREWSSQSYRGFIAYERKGHELKRVDILRGEDGELTSQIGFEYNVPMYFFNFARTLTWDNQYSWDADRQCLYFPVPREDAYTEATDRFVRYCWNGKSLEPTDTVGNPRLHESLREFHTCYHHTRFEQFQVRIDSMADGRLRYSAWDKNDAISDTPWLVIYGKSVGDEYHFYNQAHIYVVTKKEPREIRIYYSTNPDELGEPYSTYTED